MPRDDPFDEPPDVGSSNDDRQPEPDSSVPTAPADPADPAVDPDEPMNSA